MKSKYELLLDELRGFGSVAVALSGGVDSGFLLHAAVEAVGPDKVLALTATTPLHMENEIGFARSLAERYRVRHQVIELDPLSIEAVRFNKLDRCYHCKRAIFTALWEAARAARISHLADGTNADDTGAYRPGLKALEELKVSSPLKDCSLTKAEIRAYAEEFGLEIAKKPSRPCLATRLPYDTELKPEDIRRIGEGERVLEHLGFTQLRLRHHGGLARIEVEPADFEKVLAHREKIVNALKDLGYQQVTLDLQGFRSGSYDEKQTAKGGIQ